MGRAVWPFVSISILCLVYYVLISPQLVAGEKFLDSNTKPEVHEQANTKRNLRSIYGLGPRMLQISRSKIPIELDLLVDNDEVLDKTKRFDDYGHLRFGKRAGEDQFDDYGHMRFGRNSGI